MKIKSIMKNSLRSLNRNKRSYIACIIVLSLGIGVFAATLSILEQIETGIAGYYEETRFGDVFAQVTAMPKSALSMLERLDGIKSADGALTEKVRIVTDDPSEMLSIKLIGADLDEDKKINQYTYRGEPLEYNTDIWIGKSFFQAHGLGQGDTMLLLISGRETEFTIRGIGESPEYITVVSEDAVIPDEKTYTIGFVPGQALENMLGKQGILTEVSFLLEDGVEFSDIEQELEQALERYGLHSLTERKDQMSNYYIVGEIGEITALGTILPAIFLAVTFIMIYIMLKRLIEQERGEIGTCKAFGFHSGEIISGYMLHGLTVGIFGFLLGLCVSLPFGNMMYGSYQGMYSLPDPNFILSAKICGYAALVSILISCLAVAGGAVSVLKVNPAEAMRPEAPKMGKSKINFNSAAVNLFFNASGVMALRNIMRHKVRSSLVVLSVLFAFALVSVVYAMGEACEFTIMEQPRSVELYDIKATLKEPAPKSGAVPQVESIQGVYNAEGILVMNVQLLSGNRKETAAVYGVPEDGGLYRIKDVNGQFSSLPDNGLILGEKLAAKLNVNAGDTVELKSPYLLENRTVVVESIISEAMGPGCYMELENLSSLFYETAMVNNLLIKVDPDLEGDVLGKLLEYPQVSGTVNQERALEVNRDMLESLQVMIYTFIAMAFLMGFGAIYNISKISLSEKKRELATMRIMGYTVDETAAMSGLEQWIMLAVGIILGFPPALLLKDYIASIFDSDYYTISVELSLTSSLVAAACCVLALVLSNMSAKREIRRFELVEVLRERE